MSDEPTIELWRSTRFGGTGCPKLGARKRRIQALVIHSTEGGETMGSRRGVCSWWDNPAAGGNAHLVVDAGGAIQYAEDDRAAWHASQANHWAKGYEICGRAGQTREQWLDDLSSGALRLAAQLMAADCDRYGIEVRWLSDSELLMIHAGDELVTGITDHATIDRVWSRRSPHWDPGPSFPRVDYMLAVQGYLELRG